MGSRRVGPGAFKVQDFWAHGFEGTGVVGICRDTKSRGKITDSPQPNTLAPDRENLEHPSPTHIALSILHHSLPASMCAPNVMFHSSLSLNP